MKMLITGGAGFIGSNAASRYLQRGWDVVVIDNLAREGVHKNLEWLRPQGSLQFEQVDVRDAEKLASVFRQHRDADQVLHLAAQVAVTTSVTAPREDFEINALGAFNVLEAIRLSGIKAPVLYSSTNKVYGELTELGVEEKEGRYAYKSLPFGVPESQNLDFHSPYGCSKGAADQYFIDYHRIYGLRTIVFRQSCIYGYRQFGAEDQGWVAWFMIASQLDQPITVYGDGKQVRDILFIDDLLDAYDTAFAAGDRPVGRAYNIGGGPDNILSLLELIQYIGKRQNRKLPFDFADWRPGDQKVFVSDIRLAQAELCWTPKIRCVQGLELLYDWVSLNKELFVEEYRSLDGASQAKSNRCSAS
ncbi:MAG TPA: SDR family NAD(P)-dependent oxidoreductase [Bryobacteraceae bacterium]|nr:SDR family NAD(P)-dependent oxidoreductase [Bryobacteraceae bacterium]